MNNTNNQEEPKPAAFLQSRGRCLCQTNEDMKKCAEYQPTPTWCKHLSDVDGLTCIKALRKNC